MKLLVGTHHRVGTNFFFKVFQDLSSEEGLAVWFDIPFGDNKTLNNNCSIYFHYQSHFGFVRDAIGPYKFLHAVRNPAMVIYSSMNYHLRGTEEWLHVPSPLFNGRSYHQALKSLSTIDEMIAFELKNSSGRICLDMLSIWSAKNSGISGAIFNIDIDSVSRDASMAELALCWEVLELEKYWGIGSRAWLNICKRHCLWNLKSGIDHSFTGLGDPTSYKKSFGPISRALFRDVFGDFVYRYCFS